MNLTLALPALCYDTAENHTLPPLNLPSLNAFLRFGSFHAQAKRPSEWLAQYLWHGSLLAVAKQQAGVPPEQAAVFASPVWQKMGMHEMSVLGGGDIQVRADEAAMLCQGLNEFYQQDGWQFHPIQPDLWLLTLPAMPDWQVPCVWDVLGQADGTIRAEGSDSRTWLSSQTEMQMWLHSHAVSQVRQAEGVPAINGVWLWQDVVGQADEHAVLASDHPAACFFAGTHLDAPYDFASWQDLMAEQARSGDGVVLLDDLNIARYTADVWHYADILHRWENRWFAPAWQALQVGRLKSLIISTDGERGGCLVIKSKSGRAFWKRQKSFAGVLG